MADGSNYGNRVRCLDLFSDAAHLLKLIDNKEKH